MDFWKFLKNGLRANWKVLKRKCSKKGISKKGNFFFGKVFKHLKNAIFKIFLFWKYLCWNISFLKPSDWPSKHFSDLLGQIYRISTTNSLKLQSSNLSI